MKAIIIILLSFYLVLMGCSASKNVTADNYMQIKEANFHDWREAPVSGSELPEVGTDLTIMLENWPEGFVPVHVAFRGKKSVSAKIAHAEDAKDGVIVQAKIIRSSSVLMERSDPTEVSDRLVYLNSKGEMRFIEIKGWKEVKK